jgi:bifunctional UDP-N-acetylglucosamine pyrophosphorylase/glucosamine-1-phosphate N-acetyltransferase
MANDLVAVVMAGGLGTRMKSATPKHLHPLLGRRMVDWVVRAAQDAGVERVVVVASPDSADSFAGVEVAVQHTALGTGDAVRAAREALAGVEGDVLVLNGDVPGLSPELVRALVETHRSENASGTELAFQPHDLRSYGRIVRDGDGRLARIVEAGDASPEELALGEVNSGIYVFRADKLWPLLDRLEPHNAQGELYVTDTVGLLVEGGDTVAVHNAPVAWEVEGINTRVELAVVAAKLRERINEAHMLAGVTIVDPGSTWIEVDVESGRTRPSLHRFEREDEGGHSAAVGPHAVAVDAVIGPEATVGPFCYLRPNGSRSARRPGHSWRSRTRTSAKVRRCRTRTSATPMWEGTTAAGAITANYRPELGRAVQDDDRSQRPYRRTYRVRCSGQGCRQCLIAAARSSRRRSRPRARDRPAAGQQGRIR